MKNNQIDEGRRGLGNIMFDSPTDKLTMKEKLAAALTGAGIVAGGVGGAFAGHKAAEAIYDPAHHPELLQPLYRKDGTPMLRKGGHEPVTPMVQVNSIAEPVGGILGLGAGGGLVAGAYGIGNAIGNRRRRNSSSPEPIKEYYKQRLNEKINEGVFNKYNPIVQAVTGIGNVLRGRPFSGEVHNVTSVPERRRLSSDEKATIQNAKNIGKTREAIMTSTVKGYNEPIIKLGPVVPSPKIVEKTQKELEAGPSEPERTERIIKNNMYTAAINGRQRNIRRN